MQVAYCDLETFSPVPVNHGTHAYAEQAEAMLWPYAIDDGAPKCWDVTTGSRMPSDLEDALSDERVLTVWHNGGMFDRVVLLHAMGIDLPIERIHDTMVRAMAHSLPGSLDKLGDILQLDMRKDKRGKDLIQLFCKPRPKNMKLRRATRETHPKEWQEFIEYALADIPPMRELYRKLPRWNYQGAELELWHLDQRINMRGVAIDRELATAAIATSSIAQTSLAKQAQELTDGAVQAATQRDAMLGYIRDMFDVELPDLRGSTVEKFLETQDDMPAELRELLLVRASASKTSTAKYKKILNYLSSDDRLRGTLSFCGATRTGRWCLAEGTMVLVMEPNGIMSEKPIEKVLHDDLVFDGDNFVAHEGVVFNGVREVIKHDEIVATPEHKIYLDSGTAITLEEAKKKGLQLWKGNMLFTE